MSLTILRFIEEGRLLRFTGQARPDEWMLIGDFAAAKERAWTQSDDFPCWTDLREAVASRSRAGRREAHVRDAVHKLVFAYTPVPFTDLEDDVAADLAYCVAYHALGWANERLYPLLLEAYAAGGWPCGWSDDYPEGRLCVFWPSAPSIYEGPTTARERRLTWQKQRARERLRLLDDAATEATWAGSPHIRTDPWPGQTAPAR